MCIRDSKYVWFYGYTNGANENGRQSIAFEYAITDKPLWISCKIQTSSPTCNKRQYSFNPEPAAGVAVLTVFKTNKGLFVDCDGVPCLRSSFPADSKCDCFRAEATTYVEFVDMPSISTQVVTHYKKSGKSHECKNKLIS